MKTENKLSYNSAAVYEAAKKIGFTEEFNAGKAPILQIDTTDISVYLFYSGKRAAFYTQMPARMVKRSAKEQWERDHRNEWTLLRDCDEKLQFIDHYVDKGVTRFTAGAFSSNSRYRDKLISSGYELTKYDQLTLTIRDYRWENHFNTKRSLNKVAVSLAMMQTGGITALLTYLSDNIENIMSEKHLSNEFNPYIIGTAAIAGASLFLLSILNSIKSAEQRHIGKKLTLDHLLFNEDVIRYLERG